MLRRPIESTQYLSIRYTERLAEAGIEPSVGSKGDSYDNALAETIIGLFKTEVIHRQGPWRGFEDVGGSGGSITTASWSRSAIFRRSSMRRHTGVRGRTSHYSRHSSNQVSDKLGAVQIRGQ